MLFAQIQCYPDDFGVATLKLSAIFYTITNILERPNISPLRSSLQLGVRCPTKPVVFAFKKVPNAVFENDCSRNLEIIPLRLKRDITEITIDDIKGRIFLSALK